MLKIHQNIRPYFFVNLFPSINLSMVPFPSIFSNRNEIIKYLTISLLKLNL